MVNIIFGYESLIAFRGRSSLFFTLSSMIVADTWIYSFSSGFIAMKSISNLSDLPIVMS